MTDEIPLPGRDDAAYTFWDGTRQRTVDPLEAGAILEAECPNYLELLQDFAREVPEGFSGLLEATGPGADLKEKRKQAEDKLLSTARKMFGLKPKSDASGVVSGLGRVATMEVLTHYFVFMGQMATEARPFATSQPRASPSTLGGSPGESSAVCGSAESTSSPSTKPE